MSAPDERIEDAQRTAAAAGGAGGVLVGELPPLPEGLFCPDCGYDLRGLTRNRCPECGFSLEPARTQEPQIPWVHRREIGRFRAYWRTVAAATFRPKRFCLEILRPVSYQDAQRFRWVTILHAYVPLLVAGVVTFIRGDLSEPWDWASGPWWLLAAACTLLELVALTGMTSYAFHPRHLPVELQNRAVALSYYAAAPLAYTPLALPFFLFGSLHSTDGSADMYFGLLLAAGLVYGVGIVVGGATVGEFGKHLLRESWRQHLWREVLSLAVFGALTALILVVLPVSIAYLVVIIDSLR